MHCYKKCAFLIFCVYGTIGLPSIKFFLWLLCLLASVLSDKKASQQMKKCRIEADLKRNYITVTRESHIF